MRTASSLYQSTLLILVVWASFTGSNEATAARLVRAKISLDGKILLEGSVSVHGNRVIFVPRWRTESDEATGEVARLSDRREWRSRSVVHESWSGRPLKVGHHTFTQEVEQ